MEKLVGQKVEFERIKVPNFILTKGGTAYPLSDFTQPEIKILAEEFKIDLLKRWAEQLKTNSR